jgi:hypothetical protein
MKNIIKFFGRDNPVGFSTVYCMYSLKTRLFGQKAITSLLSSSL